MSDYGRRESSEPTIPDLVLDAFHGGVAPHRWLTITELAELVERKCESVGAALRHLRQEGYWVTKRVRSTGKYHNEITWEFCVVKK